MDNQLAAQLLYSHQFASREQILELWPKLTPEKDIGLLLVERGILARETYAHLVAYLNTQGPTAAGAPVEAGPAAAVPAARKPSPRTVEAPAAKPAPAALSAPPPVPPATPSAAAPRIPEGAARPEPTITRDESWTPSPDAAPAPEGPAQAPQQVGPESSWIDLLAYARRLGASDLHLSAGNPILVRLHGSLRAVSTEPLAPEAVHLWVGRALDGGQRAAFDAQGDLEFVYELRGWGRYRCTFLRQRRGCDITVRVVPDRIRSFEETGLPESCRELSQWAQGMVLVTGPVGCGKSGTLAALVHLVNQERHDHIITLEDPIEMIYPPARCRITQRQIGRHTSSQDAALRAALREDPDIIVIAELRDLDTIRLAVSAAETGHLVFGTMNTANAARTLFRLIDSFPPEEQGVVRNMVSESLRGVVSQQLLPLADRTGMVPACEVLLVNPAVANMIRKEETHQLGTAMLTGKSQGMVTLDDSLKALVEKGLVDPREAQARAHAPKDFDRYLKAAGAAAGAGAPGAGAQGGGR